MDIKLATKQIRIQQWSDIIKDCKASGLKVNDYCSENNISRDAYYYWLRKVKDAALIQNGFVEIPIPSHNEVAASTGLIAKLNGITLEIKEGVSTELLTNVIRVIKNA